MRLTFTWLKTTGILSFKKLWYIYGGASMEVHVWTNLDIWLRRREIIIEQRLINKESFKSIARKLGKDPTTIAKEVKNHIQFRKTGCYGRAFNDCRHRFDCPIMHLCGNLRCRRYCRLCKSHICSSLCHEHQKEICSKLLKPPYVCNGCEVKHSCTLEKRVYSATHA